MNWKKVLTIIIGIIVFIIWTYVPEDEYEDPDEKFSVTFTYDCRNIIDDTDVPQHVIIECRQLMKDLQNEPKTD